MTLWVPWMNAVRSLRPACQRSRTFLWMLLTLISLCCRLDLAALLSKIAGSSSHLPDAQSG
jgi:hypothetical protein